MQHSDRAHALLGASSSKRWLSCPPSARLADQFPNESTEAALEGTLAHEMSDFMLRAANGEITEGRREEGISRLKKDKYYSPEMDIYVKQYVDFCLGVFEDELLFSEDAEAFVEERYDFSKYVPHGFGTGDFAIISGSKLFSIDLKYGVGIPVFAEDNPQLKLYAIGALLEHKDRDIQEVECIIHQPRLGNVSRVVYRAEELFEWAESIKPIAEMAWKGEGELLAGDHCGFCPARPKCRAFKEKSLENARMDFAEPMLLEDEELVEAFLMIQKFKPWAAAVEDYMLKAAKRGHDYEGLKLVANRGKRVWLDEDEAISTLALMGYDEDRFIKKKLIGITEATKMVGGKQAFDDILGDQVKKIIGLPNLVSDSDSRPHIRLSRAVEDFS